MVWRASHNSGVSALPYLCLFRYSWIREGGREGEKGRGGGRGGEGREGGGRK